MANNQEPEWRDKKKSSFIMGRLEKHISGEIELTRTQVASAKLFLDKTLPNLANHQITGKDEGAIRVEHALPEADKAILQQYLNQVK